ncbi:alpha/beta hydrolase family protein [Roseateles sp. DB2]|uniref:alpha/beta hydrolase family protein n=1 Tax=Roseateles sp. DB2 TaxID=3453717 RepID=UPI003EE9A6E4
MSLLITGLGWGALVLALAAGLPARAAGEALHPVGLIQRDWVDTQRMAYGSRIPRPLPLTLWYPARAGSQEAALPLGPFEPLLLAPGAAPAPGRWPLLLLSHGTGGSAMSLGWLARGLAAQGYVVAGVDHHGNTAARPPYLAEGFLMPWERVRDLRAVLDQLLADPQWALHIDRQRIGALGFSIGGYTVLASLGVRLSPERLAEQWQACLAGRPCPLPPELDELREGRSAADWLAGQSALLRQLTRGQESGADLRDDRIKAGLVMAPVLGRLMDPASLDRLDRPLHLIVSGQDEQAPPQATAAIVVRQARAASWHEVAGYGHYAFLAVCTARAQAVIPALCADPPGQPRQALHRQVLEDARAFFQRALP